MNEAYEFEIRITPRRGVLDPEGETIARALRNLGYAGVRRVRSGRLVHLRVEAESVETARRSVEAMCEELIANPIIEDYAVALRGAEVGEDGGGGRAAGSVA